MTTVITKPGMYGDIPEDEYHADPVPDGSLSVTSSRLLLPPSCPALFDYHRRHPKPSTKAMDLGTVVHGMILGKGQQAEILDYPNYTTTKAKQARDAAAAAGKIPMLARHHAEAEQIARAVRDDVHAGPLFDEGDAEQSMFWRDPEFGIWLRARTDFLTYFGPGPVMVDLKTTADPSPEKFAKSADDYRYYMQDPHYRDGLAVLLGCDPDDIDFVFTVVCTEAPYLVMTYRLDPEDVALGREQNRIAREKFRDCTESGIWPKWSSDITPLELPVYARRRIESEINDYRN